MSSWLLFLLATIGLIIPFIVTYFLSLKLAESKDWSIKSWIVGTVITVICIIVTLTLSFTVSLNVMVIISAIIWGAGMGSWVGLINYKFHNKN